MLTGLLITQALNGLQLGVLLFLLAAGLTLVFGIMNFVNLAHGSLYMMGAYFAAVSVASTGSFLLGALIAAVGLIVASMLFSWYAANFADYNKTYGSLGAVVGLMMWLWIACIVVMLGAEVNSEVERQIKIENGLDPDDETDRA